MEDIKNDELFINGLAQLKPLVDKVETLEANYETSRKKVLSEDLFWSEDKSEIYHVLREHDIASSDLIKGLKKELQELLTLAATIVLGNKED
jgi:hypothetical protein|nr:MAG TPA: hypothetical protein [Caudoviricetes sp.]